MHLEVLVEERSAEQLLRVLCPRILDEQVSFDIHAFQGKKDLLDKLPSRLRGYSRWIVGAQTRLVILIDEDRQDCQELKEQLEEAASAAGLVTKTVAGSGEPFLVLNRLAIEELEAWFFGDFDALRAAYPRLPRNGRGKAAFRNPDAVTGGTWERLEKMLQGAGYHRGGLAKVTAAREIGVHMDPERNASRSFHHFRSGLLALVAQ